MKTKHPLRALVALAGLGLYGLPFVVPEALATPTFEAVQGFATGPQQPVCRLVRDASGNLYGTTYAGGLGAGTIFKVAPDGKVTTLHVFDQTDGWEAAFGLTLGTDGNLYGVAASSLSGRGIVFRTTPGGTFSIVHSFSGGADGGGPGSQLLLANDGNLYGVTNEGGAFGLGTIFRMTSSGQLTTVVSLKADAVGWGSSGPLVQAADGNFYGTTNDNNVGGTNQGGSIYRLTPAGAISAVATFDALPNMAGAFPHGVIQASDGNFYGSTQGGGANGGGTVFKMTPTGTLTLLKEFGWPDAMELYGSLVEGPDGDLYGTAKFGGPDGEGVFFKISTTGTYTTLATLDQADGHPYRPQQGFILAEDGYFYGTTTGGGPRQGGTVVRMNAAGEYTVVAGFDGNPDMWADSALAQGPDGSFYGTTLAGGNGFGGIYRMSPDARISHIASFNGGANQFFLSQLILGTNGNLYGVQPTGGNYGVGGIYKVDSQGVLSNLWSFDGEYSSYPTGVIQGADGALYGTTSQGGLMGGGVAFRLTTSGSFSLIGEFDGSNGYEPRGSMTLANDGNFYGVTFSGGSDQLGNGSVFRLTSSGELTTFAEFSADPQAAHGPVAGLIQGSDGNFYGLTEGGGVSEAGAVYKVTPDGTLSTIAAFDPSGGWLPVGKLAEGPDGAFYGVTNRNGQDGTGTVFRVTPAGTLTYVHEFEGSAYGRYPSAGLIKGADGDLYGTASDGGTLLDGSPAGGGQIFRIHFGAEVSTEQASEIGVFSGKLNATVNPGGYPTTVTFQYGTSPALDSPATVSAGTFPAGTTPVAASASLAGLAPETTYYFRAVGTNAETPVPQSGQVRSFTTSAVVPAQVATLPASGITLTTASLNATSTPGSYAAAVRFEYGTSPTLENSTVIGAGSVPANATATTAQTTLGGLTPGTTYYYRALSWSAENQVTQSGEILSFTTVAVVPSVVVTQAASGIGLNGATLNSLVTPGTYDATVTFEYGTSPAFAGSTTVAAGTVPANAVATSAQATLTTLAPGTTYYFRAISVSAVNQAIQIGASQSFTTAAVIPAAVTTQSASSITTNGATLNATVSAGTYATAVAFQYGTSATLATSTTVNAGTVSAGASTAVQASLGGLAPGTTYYYRVVGTQQGSSTPQSGQIASFTTVQASTSSGTIAVQNGRCQSLENGDTLSFDDTRIGDSDTITLTIRNSSSTAALTGVALVLDGKDKDAFSIVTAPAATLAPGRTTTCVIRFRPTDEDKFKAKLQIVSSDAKHSPIKLKLEGEGLSRRGGGGHDHCH